MTSDWAKTCPIVRGHRGQGVKTPLIGVFLTHPPLGNASAALRDGGPRTASQTELPPWSSPGPKVWSRQPPASATQTGARTKATGTRSSKPPHRPQSDRKLPSPSRVAWRMRRALGLADMQSAATPTHTRRKDRGQQPPGEKTARVMRGASGQVGETCDVFVGKCARIHARSRRPARSPTVVGAACLSCRRTSSGARRPRRCVPLPVPG